MKLVINIEKKHFYILVSLISVLSILIIANGAYVGHSWNDIAGGSPVLSSLKVTGDVEVDGELNASNGIKIGAGTGDEGKLRWSITSKGIEINNGSEWTNLSIKTAGDTIQITNIETTNVETTNIETNIVNTTTINSNEFCEEDGTNCKTIDELGAETCPCGACWTLSATPDGCGGTIVSICTPDGVKTSGSVGRCSCFTANTKVLMFDGSYKNIQDIKIGEKLKSKGGYNTVIEYDRPLLTFEKDQRLMSINEGDFFITDNHPVMTTKGWAAYYPESAKSEAWDILHNNIVQLKIGDEIILANEKTLLVKNIKIQSKSIIPQKLYNFVLDGDNTYYANEMLVLGFVPDKAGRFLIEKEH
jgi:hypothetical protein